ncbi:MULTISPECIES: arsenate reductase (glutaredoxin) [unclassified Pseudophaeobacter]|uniref:arsenate reductase (glutaredoxin) n=1 Tax=unclassified Pseudophaeobacter TaxID=2637024 RepID=UPI000EFA8622|nr:arsenate reductase (glutaredoxin) [Pseudophaeobacter sp. EL27]
MITYWHNPRCSKSRAGLALFEEKGVTPEVRLYLQDAPSLEELQTVQAALGLPMIQMMRTGEKIFKELGLQKDSLEADLLTAMVEHPILIERPIAIKGDRAVIGRPTEALAALL